MKMTIRTQLVTSALLGIFAHHALAEVSAEEAKQLGGSALTQWGAEKAGNKDGTIPEYKGESISVPASYDPKDPGRLPDPWNDKPLFSITAQNAKNYADKLDGMMQMFAKYPNFRMDVYPTRRTAKFPKYILDNMLKNATQCKAADNEQRLQGCYGGTPFPIPKTGSQLMWNHITAYEGFSNKTDTDTWVVTATGAQVLQARLVGNQEFPLYDPTRTGPAPSTLPYYKVRLDGVAPARKVGEKLVLIDSLDWANVGRRAWQYIPGQRRVKLAPDLAYDTPSPYSGGSSTMDDSKVFDGALDRYEWKLIGKKEKYVMYNSFKLTDNKVCPNAVLLTKSFVNPDCVRWELHRVWEVEAKLKPGFRHIYQMRKFYFDEDGYSAGMSEAYDAAGKLYRINTNTHYPFYDASTGANGGSNIIYDLQTGIYNYNGTVGLPGVGFYVVPRQSSTYFSPEALAGEGIR